MTISLDWNHDMEFQVKNNEGLSISMDAKAPIGKGQAMTPKELVVAGLGGCTAMDVIALLKKHKQNCTELKILVDTVTSTSGHPSVFTEAKITFKAQGQIDSKILLESVHLSQTKYCGVSAMLSKAMPIHYTVELNGKKIGEGHASFSSTQS